MLASIGGFRIFAARRRKAASLRASVQPYFRAHPEINPEIIRARRIRENRAVARYDPSGPAR
jgi:hypothetical protein